MIKAETHITPLLTTKDLVIGFRENYHEHTLLKNLNLQLLPAEIVCFMGVNGVGKSTLIRTLSGLQQPVSGYIHYAHEGKLSTHVAVVLTDRVTATHLTVYELITFGRYPYLDWRTKLTAADLEIIDGAIDRINIRHLCDKRLYQLSDGQLQMAMIARALVQNTDIILLDEPTAHLDLNNRVEIMNTLRKLSREMNKAILVATHELDLALQTADTIWLAGNDHEIKTGIPEDLVLNGSFDDVFKFKGFDLRTGRVQQTPFRNISVKLIGEGYAYRWTKNALERNGYIIDESGKLIITILHSLSGVTWQLTSDKKEFLCHSLAELLDAIR